MSGNEYTSARLRKETVNSLKRLKEEGDYDSIDETIQAEIDADTESLRKQVDRLEDEVKELETRFEDLKEFVRKQTVESDTG